MAAVGADDPTVPTHYLARLATMVCEQMGMSMERVLAGTGLTKETLLHPRGHMSLGQHRRLIENALTLTAEPALGLHFGRTLHITAHGSMGYAILSSECVEQALARLSRYYRLHTRIMAIALYKQADTARLRLDDVQHPGPVQRFLIETFLSSFCNAIGLVAPDILACSETRVTYAEPEYAPLYRQFCAFPIHFACSHNEIRIPHTALAQPLLFADPIAAQMADEECERALASLPEHRDIKTRVRELLRSVPLTDIGVDSVATALNMAPRTLRRELSKHGTSFQRLLDQARGDAAVDYLTRTTMSIEEIAHQLGYSDASNFARAFKRWRGDAPGRFRDASTKRSG